MATKDTRITDIETKMTALVSGDTATGVISSPESLYEDCIPESLTKDGIAEVHQYDRDYTAAGARVVVGLMKAAAIATPELKSQTHSLPMHGRDSVAYTLDDNGLTVALTTTSVNTNAGDLKKTAAAVKDWIKEGKAVK